MTGPAGSVAIGSSAALIITSLFTQDVFVIALFGGIGGISRWLWFFLNGIAEPWQKLIGHLAFSAIFVTGVHPIAIPALGLVFGEQFATSIGVVADVERGIAYFTGVFAIVLFGAFEDRIKLKAKKDE